MTTYVSDERLADIIDGFTGLEICAPGDHLGPEETLQLARELQSLRSLSSDSVSDGSKGVRVKTLEWTQVIPGRLFADLYMIERLYMDDWRLFLRADNHGDRPKFIAGPFTLDEAKAAAQADYEQRILSALDNGTGGQQPVADPLRERLARISEARAKLSPGEYPEEQPSPDGLYEPLYPSPTEPKAGVVITDEMVERFGVAFWGKYWSNHPDDMVQVRTALTAALSKEQSDGE